MANKIRILVLNGSNINLFGRREPHIYGNITLEEINSRLRNLALEIGAELIFLQSNHEGVLLDTLHSHIDDVDGAILNPGGMTWNSNALHDAINAMPFPVIEVHMSNLAAREEWRHKSAISPAAKGLVQGLNWRSYTVALRALVEMILESRESGAAVKTSSAAKDVHTEYKK
jgi:3-dehydroquinate dehydratase-2